MELNCPCCHSRMAIKAGGLLPGSMRCRSCGQLCERDISSARILVTFVSIWLTVFVFYIGRSQLTSLAFQGGVMCIFFISNAAVYLTAPVQCKTNSQGNRARWRMATMIFLFLITMAGIGFFRNILS